MSLSDRRHFLALACAAAFASGCGFTPAYAPGGPAAGLAERIEIAAPGDLNAFVLVERLEERLGRSQAPRFRLTYRIETDTLGLAITPENAVTRFHAQGRVSYEVTEIASGRRATVGAVQNFTAFSAAGTTVVTAASRDDAFERLMRILADQIVSELVATASGWADP